MRYGKIIIYKPDPHSEGDSSYSSSEETEVAEIAETATLKYITSNRRSERRRNMSKIQSASRRSSVSSSGSHELPILRILSPDKSPPLMRSHYSSDADERLQQVAVVNHRPSSRTHAQSAEHSDRLMLGVLTSGSRTTDYEEVKRRVSFHHDVHGTRGSHDIPDVREEASLTGFSKLFKNLNIAERLKQQKTTQQRLNIHNLPEHMKEQLKHIYVY